MKRTLTLEEARAYVRENLEDDATIDVGSHAIRDSANRIVLRDIDNYQGFRLVDYRSAPKRSIDGIQCALNVLEKHGLIVYDVRTQTWHCAHRKEKSDE